MNRQEVMKFLRLLHGSLNARGDGRVAFLVKSHRTGRVQNFTGRPGEVPRTLDRLHEAWHVWISVCSFSGLRAKDTALLVPALWCDLDPPKDAETEELLSWRQRTREQLQSFAPEPSLVVDSGRGFHGYWLFETPVQLDGNERNSLAEIVVGLNRRIEVALGGDQVADLARVMRLPGTVNPKNGELCRVFSAPGTRYSLAELESALPAPQHTPPPATSVEVRMSRPSPSPDPRPLRRGRGRPPKGVTIRDLRSLPAWARNLVVGGAWRSGRRYRKAGGGGQDRSRADLAAVQAMVNAGWPDERIVAAFQRTDWLIGDRFRELFRREGAGRAEGYLTRTISRARSATQEGGK